MNRGTAFKWVEMLQSGAYKLCNVQSCLRMTNNDGSVSYDHIGVLCNLLDPNEWTEGYISNYWHGEPHYIKAAEDLKRGKIKHQEFLFVDEFDVQHSLADMTFRSDYTSTLGRNEPWHVTDLIRKYYEQF